MIEADAHAMHRAERHGDARVEIGDPVKLRHSRSSFKIAPEPANGQHAVFPVFPGGKPPFARWESRAIAGAFTTHTFPFTR
jgi:hypothetical protein